MGLRDDQQENDRIAARNAKIKKLLAEAPKASPEGDAKSLDAPKTAEPRKASAAAVATGAVPSDSGKEVSVVEGSSRPQGAESRPKTVDEISVAYGRKPKPWQDARGRQVRPQTQAEIQAEQDRAFLKSQWDQDQIHAAAVKAAEKEQAKEQAYLDKKAAREKATGKRSLRKDTISLEEARRLGYLQPSGSNSNDDGNNWSSPGNEGGIFCGGR